MEEAMEVTGSRSFGVAYNKEIALSMLKNNIDINTVYECTGLSIEKIKN